MTQEELNKHIAEIANRVGAELKPGLGMIMVLYHLQHVEEEGIGPMSWASSKPEYLVKVLRALLRHYEGQN